MPGEGEMAAKKKAKKKYGATASETVKKALHEQKRGRLKSGRSKKKVKSRKQAIAIGLSEARAAGAKVPAKKSSRKAPARKKTVRKKTKSSRKKS